MNAGSVLSGGGSVPSPQASVETWVNMVNEIQRGSLSTRLGIPMIYGIDAVHGHNNVYRATVFPHNIGLGATRQVFLHVSKAFDGRIIVFSPALFLPIIGFYFDSVCIYSYAIFSQFTVFFVSI